MISWATDRCDSRCPRGHRKHTGRTIDYETWDPLNDAATQDAIRCGDTIGCFYIESPATRLLLRKLWLGMPSHRRAAADVFEYLVMVSSLVRPATNPFVEEFIRQAQEGSCAFWHPKLKGVLNETHGIMTYQEDVSKVAMALADFSVEDADQLRKIISSFAGMPKQMTRHRKQSTNSGR